MEESAPSDDERQIPNRFTWSVGQGPSHQLFVLNMTYGCEEFVRRHPIKPSIKEEKVSEVETANSHDGNEEKMEQERLQAKEELDNEAIARLPSEAGSAILDSEEVLDKFSKAFDISMGTGGPGKWPTVLFDMNP